MAHEEKTSDPVMQEALERFEESQDGSDYNRETYEHDIKFARLGDQWPEDVKNSREAESRPCLTINKLNPLVRQVVNDARQNKPSITVSPVDSDADVETAEVISGLVRHIERNSNADVAYDTAMDCAAAGGFGFFQIGIDYVNDESFDMEVGIHRIADPLSVHWDVNSFRFDAADWDYCFISEMMKEEVFEKLYPDAQKVSFENSDEHAINWTNIDQVRVAAYWSRELEKRTLFQLSDGRAVRKDDIPAMAKKFGEMGGLDFSNMSEDDLITGFLELSGLQITAQREVEAYKVIKRIISGVEVLEEIPWPGSTIPVVPVWGDEVIIDNRRFFRSMVADAIDSQRMFNYWRSAETELVALAPKAPWVGPEGFVPAGHEEKWASANTRSFAYLEYDPTAGPPTRQPFAGVPAGALQESLNASDDIKATTGIYDASLGARSNETSGRAILARQREGDNANFHFPDNLNRAIQYAGKVLVEIIPHVYSPQKTIRILGEDSKEDVIQLVQDGQEKNYKGANKLYDLTTGRYDVAVKAGPSYASQREETRETLIEIMRSVPDAGPYIGDIVMEHLDFQGADRVAKRLKMLLPPEIRDQEDQESVGDLPEEAQAALQQANQQIQMLKQALEQAQQENLPELEKLKMEKATHEIDLMIKKVELELKQREADMKEVEAAMKIAGQGDSPTPEPQPTKEDKPEPKAPTIKMEHSAEYETQGMEMKAAMSSQIAEALDRLTASNQTVAAMAMAPTKIIRDDTGKAVGAVKEMQGEMTDE